MATWTAWGNQYWPAKYLIDATGHVRYAHFGEGDYDKTEAAIRALLKEPGAMAGKPAKTYDPAAAGDAGDLPRRRARAGLRRRPQLGTHDYRRSTATPREHFSLGGRWTVTDEAATAGTGASLRANVTGKDVYLVLSGPGTVDVTVDGKPRADRQGHHAEALPPALAAAGRHPRSAAALLARRRGLRVHVRVIRKV